MCNIKIFLSPIFLSPICIIFLLQVGFFGNVAFCDTEISGDIINNFKQNSLSDGIKLCFVFSIAVSIPLIVFPCRLSLYNLLFPQVSIG